MLLLTIMFVEQDAELSRLHQVIGQLQEEKEKASERAKKLAEDLEGESFMVEGVPDMISSFDESLWCLQNTVEEPRHSSMCWSLRQKSRGENLTP